MQIDGKLLTIFLYIVIIGFGITAIFYIGEFNIPPKVHIHSVDFEWKNYTSTMLLRFESDGGAFTAGNKIKVQALLAANVSTETEAFFIIYFPNTLDIKTYDSISNKKNWDFNKTDTSIEYTFPAKHFANLIDYPPRAEMDVIWTQEGSQDMVLIFDKTPIFFDEFGNITFGNHIIVEDVINIQSSDARLQIKSNNTVIGLTLAIICLTFTIGVAKYDRFQIRINDKT